MLICKTKHAKFVFNLWFFIKQIDGCCEYLWKNEGIKLISSLQHGDKEIVELLLKNLNVNVNLQDQDKVRVDKDFIYVIMSNIWVVCVLLKNDCSSLILASENGHKEIVELLLKVLNININLPTKVCIISIFLLFIVQHKFCVFRQFKQTCSDDSKIWP